MAASAQVVDIGIDPLERRSRRRRALLRVGLPIAGVAVMIAAILGIALYSHEANRAGALTLSNDLLETLDSRIAVTVSAYLDPAARFVRIDREIVGDDPTGANLPLAETAAIGALKEIPQVANLSFADGAGNFVLVRRGVAGGFDTKIIRNDPGPRSVTWVHRDATGQEVASEEDPGDDYDPRSRPWYEGALNTDELFWTGVYVFFSDRAPGVTVSLRHLGRDGRIYVFGADITLDELSRFLGQLEIGRHGQALIMDGAGRLIASPKGRSLLKESNGALATLQVDELGDPVVAAAYDHYRVQGPGRRVVTVGGQRYITAVTALPAAGQGWFVLMTVPESDFVGFLASNNRSALLMSLGVVLVAGVLAFFLVRQGLRADRTARELRERERAIGRESEAYAQLAAQASLFDPERGEPPRALTETLAEVGAARRASVWRLTADRRFLRCEDSFDRDTGGHTEGMQLHHDELPQFFRHLLQGEEIETPDAAQDRRTADLHRVVMSPVGSRSLVAVPVRQDEDVVGAVWLEDAASMAGARDFVRAAANMVAPRMPAAPPIPTPRKKRAAPAAGAVPEREPVRSFTAELARRGIDPDTIDGELYSDVAVLVVHFTDPVALAVRPTDAAHSLSNQISCAMQETAHTSGIPYLKIVGQDVVAAAGYGSTDGNGAMLIAQAALSVRDHCLSLFEDADHRQEFRIGIDCGMAIGSTIGTNPRIFNLWGEAVRLAESMADTALPGTIQVTGAAYERLRQEYLFRPRGSFYLPYVGESRTYVLAGRL